MHSNRWKSTGIVSLIGLSCLALLPGLGTASRLTYHEAFVAQGAREMLASGQWVYPTISGLPWLEKPPLPWWAVAVLGRCTGRINETVARLPSVIAAIGLVLAVAIIGKRYHGPLVGVLAGAVQATTLWTVIRGRLAEADISLTCVLAWIMVALDGMRTLGFSHRNLDAKGLPHSWRLARWWFFGLMGASTLIKGIGFGGILAGAVGLALLLRERDWTALRRLWFLKGWTLAALIGLAWPLAMVVQHGSGALELWALHLAHRVAGRAGPFAVEPWWEYISGILTQALPWTPLAVIGAWSSLSPVLRPGRITVSGWSRRTQGSNRGLLPGDELLWVWAVVPLALLSLAAVRNAHYVVFAQIPWSIWSAVALARWGAQLYKKGWTLRALRRLTQAGFIILALTYGLGLCFVVPHFDRRGQEWAFYETVNGQLSSDTPLALLYDEWDRDPYPSPFGSIPHDLAVRLFYLRRPACWHSSIEALTWHHYASANEIGVIGRQRDTDALRSIGRVEILGRGPDLRRDRTYFLFRVTPQRRTEVGHNALNPIVPLDQRTRDRTCLHIF